ncbi:protein of unknown function [Candidatus Hydrogenisulfobacillus filiaventi]|uniref:Uncharacterized protein n=1 Tax=Candidatus Hydrogenisulfobacillus filiaventi TaxID=2707344 RepID=A0A6F8ZEH2_9FIRM|nr:protein of unknown function [Candidatus Hydrogenisulfobacillus filiaventi]
MEGEQGRPPPVREHSRPQPVVVTDLNQAWRQELWYLDTLVACLSAASAACWPAPPPRGGAAWTRRSGRWRGWRACP